MIQTVNMTTYKEDTMRFAEAKELNAFLALHGLDGVEILPFEVEKLHPDKLPGGYTRDNVVGLHLAIEPCYVDFWTGNEEGLLDEFGDRKTWVRHYGGEGRDILLNKYRVQLELAAKMDLSYVVFHVSDVSCRESVTYDFAHTDEEVIDVNCEIINALLDGKDYHFDFLCENLWWAGHRFTRPEITKRLIEGIHYPQKGLMLDTGHLLHCNNDLANEEDAVDYVLAVLKQNREFLPYIKGIHLQQSLTGAYVKEMLASHVSLPKAYDEKFGPVMEIIYAMDLHLPWTTERVREIVDFVKPKYLTHEFLSVDLTQLSQKLTIQQKALWGDRQKESGKK